uniref:Phospholipid/glycerol acyltransferase domain-containing protein n=1 Tax=Phaeomonas parva TaxID=124430 RepID=A0A7S1TWL4_9STRA|mmetsp:Transcript_20220/g.61339  ORF Transcript_20220/g.61339 Transcript_20220/m.61339 type:complete len:347 (+) Transcript_20220:155-1195(+)
MRLSFVVAAAVLALPAHCLRVRVRPSLRRRLFAPEASGADAPLRVAPDPTPGSTTALNAVTEGPIPTYEKPAYEQPKQLSKFMRPVARLGVALFMIGAAGGMPLVVAPFYILEKLRFISKVRRESWCLKAVCHWVRLLSPLAFNIRLTGRMPKDDDGLLVWSSNHVSNFDFFTILASASKMCRERSKWPRVIYWQGLESNPLFKLFGRSCGMVPVAMENTGSGNQNVYDASSFRKMYTAGIGALNEGWDLAILPEGQLNPRPEEGLQQIYPGPHSFSKRAGAKLQLVGIWGTEHIWKAGTASPAPTARDVHLHLWEPIAYESPDAFVDGFTRRIEPFGLTGKVPPE